MRERRAARVRRRPAAARTARSSGTPRTRDARTSAIARSGCFRAGVALPRDAAASDVQALRLRAHTRLPRRGEKPLPKGSGAARIEHVNLLYGLGADDRPGPSLFSWTAGSALVPDGPPLELPLDRQ